ncbi:NUDIX domain-containing protein [Methanococcoides sp. SA1]|nr:NUDIX domain-containing protein [Methanococcoides sp. SA1]
MDIQEKITQIEETHKKLQDIQNFPTPTSQEKSNTKLHQIAVTAIIRNNQGKYLICKRSEKEKAFPNKWCVPGGKVETTDFINTPKDTQDHWFDVIEKSLQKEVLEETGLLIKNIAHVSNLAFMHPNGSSTLILSLHAEHHHGEVTLQEDELTDHAWVTLEEAKNYDLIENIWEQIEVVDKKFQPNSYKEHHTYQ